MISNDVPVEDGWDEKWLDTTTRTKIREMEKDKVSKIVTDEYNRTHDYSGHIVFTGLLIGVLGFSYLNKDEWPGTFPVVLPISLIAYALAILSLYRPVRAESNRVSSQRSGYYNQNLQQTPRAQIAGYYQTPQAQISGYYQCTCGNMHHSAYYGGSQNCSRCGRPMTWRS